MSAIIEAELISSPSLAPSFFPNDRHNLTPKQKAFADNYLETRNGVESARIAGYDANDATLRVIASENLVKPNIRAYLEDRYSQLVIGANETLAELSLIARYDLEANPQGPIRAQDKLKALEMAGKWHKHWDRTSEVDSDSTGATRELITILQTLTARARELQASTPQIPASVGEQTT